MVTQIRSNKFYDLIAFSLATVGCTYALLKDYKTETIATPFRNFIIGNFNRIFIRNQRTDEFDDK